MKNINESGRSMVEMLGVLAIIGVLSIGGIAGYTRAMRNWRANEIIDAANKVVVLAETEDAGTADYSTLGGNLANVAGDVVSDISATRSSKSVTITLKGAIANSPYKEIKETIEEKIPEENNARKLGGYTVTISGSS